MKITQKTAIKNLIYPLIINSKIKGDLYSTEKDFLVSEIDNNYKLHSQNYKNLNIIKNIKEDHRFVECTLVKEKISTFEVAVTLSNFFGIDINKIVTQV
jgi:tRNA(Glu) U13 pseudouridine synthase TruD